MHGRKKASTAKVMHDINLNRLDQLTKCIKSNPKEKAENYYLRGNEYFHMEYYKDAIEDFDEAVKLYGTNHPFTAKILIKRSNAYLAKGNMESALIDITHVIQFEPKNRDAHILRSKILYRQGAKVEAAKNLLLAIAEGIELHKYLKRFSLIVLHAAFELLPDDVRIYFVKQVFDKNTKLRNFFHEQYSHKDLQEIKNVLNYYQLRKQGISVLFPDSVDEIMNALPSAIPKKAATAEILELADDVITPISLGINFCL